MSMLLRRYHESPETGEPVVEETVKPGGNASRDEWETYALANGKTTEDLDGLTRNEVRDLFSEN